jgi:tryptophanyl-tRNA synthetase
MSKSASSMAGVIELLDTPEETLKKFKSSVTDDGKEDKFYEKLKPT